MKTDFKQTVLKKPHLVMLAAIFFFVSCVDNKYNFDEDSLSTEVTIGGENLGVNVTDNSTIAIKDLLDLDEIDDLTTDELGNYIFRQKQDIDPASISIDEITVDAIDMNDVVIDINNANFQSIAAGDQTIPLITNIWVPDITENLSIDISEEVTQSEIRIIEMISLSHVNNLLPSIKINLVLKGFPAPTKEENRFVDVTELKIVLPDNIVTLSDEHTFNFAKKVELVNNNGQYEGNLAVDIPIKALKNSSDSKSIIISDNINIELALLINSIGQLPSDYIDGTNLKISASLEDISLSSNTANGDMYVDSVTGKFSFNFVTQENIDGLELPEAFTDKETVLDIVHSAINATIASSIPIPLIADLTIEPILNSGVVDPSTKIEISAIDIPANSNNNYWFSDDTKYMPEGAIEFPVEISPIVNCQPDKINIELEISTDEEMTYTIPTGDFNVDTNIEIVAPIQIGSEMSIIYKLDDLIDINSLADFGNEFEITLEGDNSIPLNIYMTADALDKNGNIVDGVDIVTTGYIPSILENSSDDSEIVLDITETKKGALNMAKNIKLSFKLNSSESLNNQFLTEGQLVMLKIIARVPGGADIDLDEI